MQVGDVARQGTSVIVLPITDATSDQTQMPSATLMHAVAIWLSRSSPIANGAAAPHTVARPMIHPKNARGLGVATASPCATPGGYQREDESGQRIVEAERVGHVEQQGRPDQGDVQDVLADHHAGDRDQGRDARGGQAATPQSGGVDHDAGPVHVRPHARVRHDDLPTDARCASDHTIIGQHGFRRRHLISVRQRVGPGML